MLQDSHSADSPAQEPRRLHLQEQQVLILNLHVDLHLERGMPGA